jgi:hypothetical protein
LDIIVIKYAHLIIIPEQISDFWERFKFKFFSGGGKNLVRDCCGLA